MQPSSAVSYSLVAAVASSVLSIGLFDSCGRRLILIVSGLGVCLAHVCLGTHFILLDAKVEWAGSQWLLLVSVFIFITSFSFGLCSIPSIVASEVYAANIKPVAACIGNLTAAAAAFFAAKTYQPLVDLFGDGYVIYGHAVLVFTAVPIALFCMPETKGKTLQQIQDDLIKK